MDLVNSLFGLPPQEQLKQQQINRDVGLGGLFAAATVNPYAAPAVQDAYLKQQQAQFALGSLGARGAGSLFGFQDPELQRVSTLEGILQGVSEEVDINNPVQFYPTLQKRLQEAGFSQEAAQVGMAGQEAIQKFALSQEQINTQKSAQVRNFAQAEKAQIEASTPKMTTVPAGASVLDAEGNLLFTAPKTGINQNKVLPPGSVLVDDNGNIIARGNEVATKGGTTSTVSAGTSQIPPTKLKAGETWNPATGRIEVVKGSAEYQKQNSAHAASYKSAKSVINKSQESTKKLQALLDPKEQKAFELNFGGYNAYVSSKLPAARDFAKRLDSIKSDLKIAGLELIRQSGSIGAMTEREWPIVEELINTISPQLSEARAKQVIQEIIDRFKSMENASVDFYETEWGDSDFYKPLTNSKKDDPLGLGL